MLDRLGLILGWVEAYSSMPPFRCLFGRVDSLNEKKLFLGAISCLHLTSLGNAESQQGPQNRVQVELLLLYLLR